MRWSAARQYPAGDDQDGRDDEPGQRCNSRELAGVLSDEAHGQKHGEVHPQQTSVADGLAMRRDPAPTPVHVADFGQQVVDDDRHGGGDDVVVDACRESVTATASQQPAAMQRCVGKAIPCPQ